MDTELPLLSGLREDEGLGEGLGVTTKPRIRPGKPRTAVAGLQDNSGWPTGWLAIIGKCPQRGR